MTDPIASPTVADVLVLFRPRKHFHIRAYVHARLDATAPSYQRDRAIFTLSVAHEHWRERARSTVATIDLPGWINSGHADAILRVPRNGDCPAYATWDDAESNRWAPRVGFVGFIDTPVYNLVRVLPRAARLSMRMTLDCYDRGATVEHGIHVDKLTMDARWTRGRREHQADYCIHTDVGPHNTARFGAPGVVGYGEARSVS